MLFLKNLSNLIPLTLILVGLLSYNFISAQWKVAPNNPPSNNVEAPINVGTSTASIQNGLGAVIFTRFAAVNAMWSPQYCDAAGLNCFSAAMVNTSTSTIQSDQVVMLSTPRALANGTYQGGSNALPSNIKSVYLGTWGSSCSSNNGNSTASPAYSLQVQNVPVPVATIGWIIFGDKNNFRISATGASCSGQLPNSAGWNLYGYECTGTCSS